MAPNPRYHERLSPKNKDLLIVNVYEFPLNERVRTLLRLEHIFAKLHMLVGAQSPISHQFALQTLFEAIEISNRPDLRNELMRELERQKQGLHGLRDNPLIDAPSLETLIEQIEILLQAGHEQPSKPWLPLLENEWLTTVRNRMSIAGGTCSFDVPSLHTWLHLGTEERQAQLRHWQSHFSLLVKMVNLLLKLMRESAQSEQIIVSAGYLQKSLSSNRPPQMLRIGLPEDATHVVPEFSGSRMLVTLRLNQLDTQQRMSPITEDLTLDFGICT